MITIFAMTIKGFEIISKIIETFGPSFIKKVVSAKDTDLQNDYYREIRELCADHNISFADRNDRWEINTEFCFAVSWRWLISLEENKKLIVFHDSLLPKYRGFAPLVNSLINGERQIGVTALIASGEYDKGDIIYQAKTSVTYPLKIAEAIELNNKNYVAAALHTCDLLFNNKHIETFPQNESEATYSLWRDEEDYRIDWRNSSEQIKRHIDATGFPYKYASTFMENKKIRIIDAETVEDVKIINRDAGKIIQVHNNFPVVVCGSGLLKITKAIDDNAKTDILPLKKFRIRFK